MTRKSAQPALLCFNLYCKQCQCVRHLAGHGRTRPLSKSIGLLTACCRHCSEAIRSSFLRRPRLKRVVVVFIEVKRSSAITLAPDSTEEIRLRRNRPRRLLYLCLWLLQKKACVRSLHKRQHNNLRPCFSAAQQVSLASCRETKKPYD